MIGTATASIPSAAVGAGDGDALGDEVAEAAGASEASGLGDGDGPAESALGDGATVGVGPGVGLGEGDGTTWKLNVPRSTWPSSVTAVQRTVYVPGSSGGGSTRIVRPWGSAGSRPPRARLAPAASRISRELRSAMSASLNVATTSLGAGTLDPSAGDESTSSAWATAAPATRRTAAMAAAMATAPASRRRASGRRSTAVSMVAAVGVGSSARSLAELPVRRSSASRLGFLAAALRSGPGLEER